MKIFVLFSMFFCHIVDDYYLQGILAKLKQKSWWRENCSQELYKDLYKNDYIIALIEHSFSWSFMILLPLVVIMYSTGEFRLAFYCVALVINMVLHSVIDHLKANCEFISLTADQLFHICQVVFTWLCFYCE